MDPSTRPNGRGCLEGLAPSHQEQTSGEGESTSNLVLKQKNIVNLGLKSPTCSISSRTRQVLPYSLSKIVYSSPPVYWWPICVHITAIWCCTNKDLAWPVFEYPNAIWLSCNGEAEKLIFHFASHFIRVQIFQTAFALILTASKYFR